MPRRVALPLALRDRSFSVVEGSALGLSNKRMRGADLVRPFPGVRISGVDDLLARCRAYALRMRDGEYFSHLTAARLWGAPLARSWTSSEALHVSIPDPQRAARVVGVRGHQIGDPTVRVATVAGLPVSDPASTWLMLVPFLPDAELVAIADYFVRDPPVQRLAGRHGAAPFPFTPQSPRRPFVTVPALVDRAGQSRCRGIRRARLLLSSVREGSDSPRETELRLALLRHGLPEPDLGVRISDRAGRFVAFADMYYPQWGVVVEYDGDQHRLDPKQYDRDITRIDALIALDLAVVRVRDPQLRHDAAEAVARVRTALRRRGWRPASGQGQH